MFTKPIGEVVEYLEGRARNFGEGAERVYVSLSGGVDSAVVVILLARAFGPENVVVMYRDIRSNPVHERDVMDLQKVVGFKLLKIDANPLYDMFLYQCKEQFAQIGIDWVEENSPQVQRTGWDGAYGSLKSRFATPLAGFITKAVDGGRGRIFGTGNLEEDVLLRYYDKFGDGAVDNNILVGLTKMEVRQIAIWFGEVYESEVFARIAHKTPSADLQANGDAHNDENELTSWARNMDYDIELSYGDCEREGNIAWVCKQDLDNGVVTGDRQYWCGRDLRRKFNYSREEIDVVMFMREIERSTRHKALGIPGVERAELRVMELVD
jgi:NAD+ synthetase